MGLITPPSGNFRFSFILFLAGQPSEKAARSANISRTKESSVNSKPVPSWWAELSVVPDNTWVFVRLKYQASFTSADVDLLQHLVETSDDRDLQRAASILASMLRGRFPVIMPRRQSLSAAMLALITNKYPNDQRARCALTVLTYADRDAASQFVRALHFPHPLLHDYREAVAHQLSAINTDASLAKLDGLLAAENDPMFGRFVTRRSARYVPIEELGRRWQQKRDIVTLNILCEDWLRHIYEGYPLDEVITVMGQPQRQGTHYAYYSSKEGPGFYLELNDARQIGGWDGPR